MTAATLRPALVVALSLLLGTGCTSSETHEPIERPVRFAVLAAPELGADDGDLLSAVTSLSREKELAFVLVLGPLFARDADPSVLETFKNDLGQVAAPVYVSFSGVSPVTSGAPDCKLKPDEVLAAVEGMGPGPLHKLAYVARPERAKAVAVNALAPNGGGAVEASHIDCKRLVRFGVGTSEKDAPGWALPDIVVEVATGPEVELVGVHGDEAKLAEEPVVVRVPPLARKRIAIVTLSNVSVEVAPVAVEGPQPTPPRPVVAPSIKRKSPG